MANKKITELDAATSMASTDVLPVVDVSEDVTKKITATNLFRTLPDGTAAAPALAFADDNNTGILSPAENQLAFATGGTQRVTIDGSGNVTISGDLTVSGATTTVESTTVTIDDKNIELGSVATPTDTTADGGGITLKGATDKEIKWVNSTGYWTFNTGIDVGGNIELADNSRIKLGTGDDLQIYHNGSKSFITNSGSTALEIEALAGDLILRGTDNVFIQSGSTDETFFKATVNGAAELYYDNSKKFETTSTGVNVTGQLDIGTTTIYSTGDISLGDSDKIRLGNGDDLQIYHNTGSSFIDNTTAVSLAIRQLSDNADIVLQSDDGSGGVATYVRCDGSEGEVRLYHYGTEKLNTKSDGVLIHGELECDTLDVNGAVDITGNVELHSNLGLQDNDRLNIGSSDDLSLRHDGSNSTIVNTTGALRLAGDLIELRNQAGNEFQLVAVANGAVRLYYDAVLKLATKSDGIDVTGEVQCDSLDVDGSGDISGSLQIGSTSSANSSVIVRSTTSGDGGYYFNDGSNAGAIIYNHASNYMKFRVNGSDKGQFDSSGRLLLGTTTEGESGADDLTIATSSTTGITIRSGSSNAGNIYFSDGTSGAAEYRGQVSYLHNADSLVLGTNGAEKVRIDSSGVFNVGTTTSSPGSKFNIADGADNANIFAITGADTTTEYIALGIESGVPTLTAGGFGGNSAALKFRTANSGTESEVGRFDGSGRFLLGTTTEGAAGADNLTVFDSGTCGITIRSGTSSNGNIYFSDATSGSGEYAGYIQYRHGDNALAFGDSSAERFRITSTGAWAIEGASNYGTSGQVLTSNGNDAPTWQDAGSVSVGGASAISMNDNVKINFGASNDLQIYHDGSNSRIHDAGTGVIAISGSEVHVQSSTQGETCAKFKTDAEVELRYDNAIKFVTKSDGVDITGELQCDTLDVDGAADIAGQLTVDRLVVQDDGSSSPTVSIRTDDNSPWALQISNDSWSSGTLRGLLTYQANDGTVYTRVQGVSNNWESLVFQQGNGSSTTTALTFTTSREVKLYYQGSNKLTTKSDGVDIVGELQCDSLDVDGAAHFSGGDVDFLGVNYNAVWDTSENRLKFNDNAKAAFGDSADLQVYHTGSTSFIDNNSGGLSIRQLANDSDLLLTCDNGSGGDTAYVRCDGSTGDVILYQYGNQKLQTFSSGVDITGELQCDSLDVDGAANITGNVDIDAYIRHNGDVNSYFGFSANDTFNVATANTSRFRVSSTGQLLSTTESSTTLKPFQGCRAFCCFKGSGTVSIFSSFNVSSLVDVGTGAYEVYFTTAPIDTNYAVTTGFQRNGAHDEFVNVGFSNTTARVKMEFFDSGNATDCQRLSVAVYR